MFPSGSQNIIMYSVSKNKHILQNSKSARKHHHRV